MIAIALPEPVELDLTSEALVRELRKVRAEIATGAPRTPNRLGFWLSAFIYENRERTEDLLNCCAVLGFRTTT